MSMYDIVLGDGKEAERAGALLLTLLGIKQGEVPRYRNCWLELNENGDPQVGCYMRTGGNNRADYADQIAALQAHPQYVEDSDDRLDSTYMTIRFLVPLTKPEHLNSPEAGPGWNAMTETGWGELYREMCTADHVAKEPVDMALVWEQAFKDLEANGMTPEQERKSKPMVEALEKAFDPNEPNDGPRIIEI